MLALYDHIIQLQNELKDCQMAKPERAAARAALVDALAVHAHAECALDEALELATRAGAS